MAYPRYNDYEQRVPPAQPAAYYSAPSTSALPSREPLSREPHRVLFAGLPPDITANDLRDLLLSEPLHLSPLTTSVTSLHSENGDFQGVMLVYVETAEDAERIRAQYSGQPIDGSLVLQVHHVLPSHVSLPLTNSVAPARPVNQRSKAIPTGPKASSGPTQASQQTQRHNAQRNSTSGKKAAGAVHAQTEGAPPGLALLKRIGKAGQEGDKRKQQGGANKQKANVKSQSAGADLLSRLNPSPGDHSKNNKKKNKNTKASNGNAKVNRAKGKAA
ncbi:hypothetical protein C349_05135 [Cryptococcus neoformans var. grubii Br795]|uniref:RRM domain-containing protein n=1 Tax=Cryptococcus neoformans Tu259-1 TaxID=1230072 RepID=A0A854Q5Y5_CRYNE|nr:hypothetical protein C368_05360 [Cryptococcus neoformans var. grubii 125.91]OXG15972.1 hypothetical protein C361_05418 [Cryptococcus neoformans var. grubii Tu259-1]OXG47409.1 hypothetical protein C355_05070 [Cryptococcus neoformans var. grubii Th84]OXG76079.1 hypothetical protein C350_04984 [Cryptococcus neoformans var. grubii MW-RSA36]OXG77883.1 hypothetical protein C349_05135 [Cryptococcus neoformans var. grubii Br795]OXG81379.1 hypothetical protein C346_05040 [Cryptococcus neoformans var